MNIKGRTVDHIAPSTVFNSNPCELGEGPLWHPKRAQLFWFDILAMRLHSQDGDETLTWQFDEHVSAAGWVDHDTLLIASQTGLMLFDIPTGETEFVCALEADNEITRSNDGRADTYGGFWISTMGLNAESKAGSIYRYFDGALKKVVKGLTIPNSICFAPDGRTAYYTDTPTNKIMQLSLDDEGWPVGKASVFTSQAITPDGSVIDAQGNLWNAQWDDGRIACYAPDGTLKSYTEIDASHCTCPTFGGADNKTMFVTTARQDLLSDALENNPLEGCVFYVANAAEGLPEPQVVL